jgi:glucosyl-3-phosphoglycerate phosphatase
VPVLPISRVLVWRHGRTAWNEAGRFQGQQDPPLLEAGRAEATRAARHLVAEGVDDGGVVVATSDLGRAVDTATVLTDLLGAAPRVDPRLREHGLGNWEGLTRAEVAERFPEQYADWQAGRPVRGRGGEDAAAVGARAVAALADLPAARTAVVVTHAATGGRLIEALLGLGPEHRRLVGPLANCAWSELSTHGDRWRLLRHNVSAPRLQEAGTSARADDAAAAG